MITCCTSKVVIDPMGIAGEVDRATVDGHGLELAALWRAKALEYSFRLTVMQAYRDFRWVTARALRFVAREHGCRVERRDRPAPDRLLRPPTRFPETLAALATVRTDGHRLAVFSHGSADMLARVLANSGLGGYIAEHVSVDEVKAFKPPPAAR